MSKKYWMKRKRYGWGWTPVTWQGWTTIGAWLVFVLTVTFFMFDGLEDDSSESVIVYLCIIFISVIPLILLSYKTGPKPKWRWGKKPDDNPDEDW